MNYIIADEEMVNWLRGFLEPLEIREPNGRVLGHYTPVVPSDLLEAYARAEKLFDPVETQRLSEREAGPGRPLRDILRELQEKAGERPE